MHHVVRGSLLLVMGLVVSGCNTLFGTPTPTATNTPLPTETPTLLIVTADRSQVTLEPSWTPIPSRTPAATRTPLPSPTLTLTPAATRTPTQFAGRVGELTADNQFALEFTRDQLLDELKRERQNPLSSPIVSEVTRLTISQDNVQLEVILNNFTREGIRAEMAFALRGVGDAIRVDLVKYNTLDGSLLTPSQVTTVRNIVDATVNRLLKLQTERIVPVYEQLQVRQIVFESARLLVISQVALPPPTLIASALPTEAAPPTLDAPTLAPSATPFVPSATPFLPSATPFLPSATPFLPSATP
jgi:hypothetical protein